MNLLTRSSCLKQASDMLESPRLKKWLTSLSIFFMPAFPNYNKDFFETFLNPKTLFSSSEVTGNCRLTYLCISRGISATIFVEIFNYFVFMYSAAKSQYSFIFNILSDVAFPTLSNQNYRETESSAYERCCVRFHKRHSFVLVALAAHSFASFLVRYVFPLRATPHEKNT